MNKKISLILDAVRNLDFYQLTMLITVYTAASSGLIQDNSAETILISSLLLFATTILTVFSNKVGAVATAIFFAIIFPLVETLWMIFIILVLFSVYRLLLLKSKAISLSIAALITHIGDAITTYVGLNRGFNEMNPIIDSIISVHGIWIIFPVKLAVLPIIILAYNYLAEKYFRYFILATYLIGLYLTVSNLIIILG